MPRKKPTVGKTTLDSEDQKYHSEVVAAATTPPKKSQQIKTPVPVTTTTERRQQIRANAPATSKLADALRAWHDKLDPEIRRLASTSSQFTAFIEDHDEELTAMFLKYTQRR